MTRNRAGAFVLHDRTILLVHRHKKGREYWAVPGGGIERNETPEAAASREIWEETGLTIATERLACIVDKASGATEYYFLAHVTAGTLTRGSGPEFDPDEATERGSYEFRYVPFDAVAALPLLPPVLKTYLLGALQAGWLQEPVTLDEDGAA